MCLPQVLLPGTAALEKTFPVFTQLLKQKAQAVFICITAPSERQPERHRGWCARDFCQRHVGGDSSKHAGKLTAVLER